jgi:hypothetical protein
MNRWTMPSELIGLAEEVGDRRLESPRQLLGDVPPVPRCSRSERR